MNVTDEPMHSETSENGGRFRNTYDSVRGRASNAVGRGEDYVRRHPEGAVGASFFTGMIVGCLAAWIFLEQREDPWRREMRRLVARLKDGLHLE
jgi:hypothetical protein